MRLKNDIEYSKALADLKKLMDIDPAPKTVKGKRLVRLAHSIKFYENKKLNEVV